MYQCKICKESTLPVQVELLVRSRHKAFLNRCEKCGFLGFYDPFWLPEAYKRPINIEDVGYVQRNVNACNFLSKLLGKLFPGSAYFVDYGSGHGMLTRLMRDRGFRFHTVEPYCESTFAPFTEASVESFGVYAGLIAIEVVEHSPDPVSTFLEMREFAKLLIFTTELAPSQNESLESWPYLALTHGQHVSFYSERSLCEIAKTLGMVYRGLGFGWHCMASIEQMNSVTQALKPARFSRIRRWAIAKITEKYPIHDSLLMDDYKTIVAARSDEDLHLHLDEPKF